MAAKKTESTERRGTVDSHYHSGSERDLAGVAKRFRKDGIFGKVFSDVNNWKPD